MSRTVQISTCGGDENGRARGGKAGDQTGNEWKIRSWYSSPWDCVLRHPDLAVRNELASLSVKAAKNNAIGYDQNERTTSWECLKSVGYDPAKITKKCETDCSAGVCALTKAVGYRLGLPVLQAISADGWTGVMKEMFRKAGFEVLTAKKYLTSIRYLENGDILLNEQKHTCIAVVSESEEKPTEPVQYYAEKFDKGVAGKYRVTASALNVRAGSGTNTPVVAVAYRGHRVMCYGYYSDKSDGRWYYVQFDGHTGFVRGDYVERTS